MDDFFLSIERLTVQLGGHLVLNEVDLFVGGTEQWAIVGPGGSGKTVLIHTIYGRHFFTGTIQASFGMPETFHHQITIVEQQHHFRDLTNRNDFYYQQRYNSFDAERTITVKEDLAVISPHNKQMKNGFSRDSLVELLKIDDLLDEPLIQLSNGENKRLQLVKSLLLEKELLILDQPFIGLDVSGRQILNEVLNELSSRGIRLLYVGSAQEVPQYITHVAELNAGVLQKSGARNQFKPHATGTRSLPRFTAEQLKPFNIESANDFEMAIKMVAVNIHYGNKHILKDIDWEVRNGEKWSLSGPNGAGKSTLLSLITGDNPQAYANEIYLFDRRRGTGESIWDIKRRIGYISPELHLYFDSSSTVFQAIASGLFDTIGLFRQLNEEQDKLIQFWIELFHLKPVQNKLLSQLSAGEQRIVLLGRALIKNPPLLILDEPCQGLDDSDTLLFKAVINQYCKALHSTLIYVSHYQDEIPECVSLSLRLEQGRVVVSKT
jgi:molybdate transport system ATP-binding protein